MDHKMFCFQCEQTAGCAGCTGKAGVCGKTAEVAELQDQLTGALIGLSRAVDNAPDANEGTWRLMIEGLFTTVTNVSFNEKTCLLYTSCCHDRNTHCQGSSHADDAAAADGKSGRNRGAENHAGGGPCAALHSCRRPELVCRADDWRQHRGISGAGYLPYRPSDRIPLRHFLLRRKQRYRLQMCIRDRSRPAAALPR